MIQWDPEKAQSNLEKHGVSFTEGASVRGKYYGRNLAPQLPGVQFLKNDQGQKTAVLLNLQVHHELWQQVADGSADRADFQYLTDSHTQFVFLDFKTHLTLWQTIYDRIIDQLA
jgi:hypothetical protein